MTSERILQGSTSSTRRRFEPGTPNIPNTDALTSQRVQPYITEEDGSRYLVGESFRRRIRIVGTPADYEPQL